MSLRELYSYSNKITSRLEEERGWKAKLLLPRVVNDGDEYIPLMHLADNLMRMAKAEYVLFADVYRSSSICIKEFFCASGSFQFMGEDKILIECPDKIKNLSEYLSDEGICAEAMLDFKDK